MSLLSFACGVDALLTTDSLSPNRIDLLCIGTPRYLSNVRSQHLSQHMCDLQRIQNHILTEPINRRLIEKVDDTSNRSPSYHVMEQVGIYVVRDPACFFQEA